MFGEQLLPTVQEALKQMEATMQRSPRFDPADSDREFSVAASDYTVSILADLLLRQVSRDAPGIRLQLHPIPVDVHSAGHGLATHDVVIGPADYGFPGRHAELFRDRFVCIVDPANRASKRAPSPWTIWPSCRTRCRPSDLLVGWRSSKINLGLTAVIAKS